MIKNLFIATLLFVSSMAFAQPGSIDPTFNTFDDGTLGPGTGISGYVYSTSVQADGKIIVGGDFTSFNGEITRRITRLNANGTRDTTFNTGTGFDDGTVYSTFIQADGKIIVGGWFSSFNGTTGINHIVRLNANGTLDASFNTGSGFNNRVHSIAIQSDGKIIVGGAFTSFNGTTGINSTVRLHANGTRDTTFNAGTGFNTNVNSTSIQADGKIIVGGDFTAFNGEITRRITRLNANGTLDASFNTGSGFNGTVYSAAIQADGKIIVGGDFTAFNHKGGIKNIVRLHANGTRDTTFNTGTGIDILSVRSTSIQADGKIIVGGDFTASKAGNRIVRLNINGTLDTTFNIGILADGNVYSTSIQADGKIIVGGIFSSLSFRCIARFNINGAQDETFNPSTGFNYTVNSTSIQADGKIIAGGAFGTFNGTIGINCIARLNTNGTRDTTFNAGTGFNSSVYSTSIQADGKIIVGGYFTSFNGTTGINRIVRLNADGTRDTSYNTGTGFNNDVYLTSIQADGKIIVGGDFTSFNGTTAINRIVRLNANGTRDTSFNTGTGFNNIIYSTSIQADGKIIVGGRFTSFDGTTGINRLVRLNANGTRDATFNTGAGFSGDYVMSTSIQADEKIIVAGNFTSFNGTTGIGRIVRLHANGTRDTTFNTGTGFNGFVYSTSIQSDGKIIVGGWFTSFNGITGINNIVRLNANGSLDTTFNTGTGLNGDVLSTSVQADGKIIVAGNFSSFNGKGKNRLVRLLVCIPTASSQNVTVCNTYKWLTNGITYTSSGTYTAKLITETGCDSIITLNLTIKKSTSHSQNVTACDTYKWLANGTTYTSSGTYTALLTNAAGCDSTVTLNLTMNKTPVLTTNVNGVTITANETGATYQWIDCNNANAPITGEINQSFTATANGSYAVIVTKNTCSDTSACVNITKVGVNKIEPLHSNFQVFPNPNNGTFSLQTNYTELGKISITNALGELVFSEMIKAQKAEINLSTLGSGIYVVEVIANGFIGRQKIVIGK